MKDKDILGEIDMHITQMYEQQRRLIREVELFQAKSEAVGECRSKLERMRDMLSKKIKSEEDPQPAP